MLSLSFIVLALDLFQMFVNPRLVDQNDSFPAPIIFFTRNVAVFDKTPMKVSLPKVSALFTEMVNYVAYICPVVGCLLLDFHASYG